MLKWKPERGRGGEGGERWRGTGSGWEGEERGRGRGEFLSTKSLPAKNILSDIRDRQDLTTSF